MALVVVSLVRLLEVSEKILASIGLGLSPNTFFQRLFQSLSNAVIRHNKSLDSNIREHTVSNEFELDTRWDMSVSGSGEHVGAFVYKVVVR